MNRRLAAGACALTALAMTMTMTATEAMGATPATPVDVNQFQSELTVAITASGAFAAGQMLRHDMVDVNARIPAEKRGVDQVNADGSLILQRTGAGRTWQVRCVARDQCWERVLGRQSDRKWHSLPAGAINYITATAATEVASLGFWPGTATFDISVDDAAAQVFTARYLVSEGATNIDRFIVAPGSSERTIARQQPGKKKANQLLLIGFRSLPAAVKVTAPPKNQIGRPATANNVPPGGFRLSWRVRINAPA